MTSAILFENVSFAYELFDHTLDIFNDLSFSINEDDVLIIKGPSGSGKSTLLKLLVGIELPNSGKINVLNNNLGSLDTEMRAIFRSAYVGVIFQDYQLIPVLNCIENVMLPLELAEINKSSEIYDKSLNVLKSVGLEHRIKHFPNQLSGGEQQRTTWARSIVNNPDLLVADEPTANIDDKTREHFFDLIDQMLSNQDFSSTIVISTHDSSLDKYATCFLEFKDEKFIFSRN